jgi:hypothetical protein
VGRVGLVWPIITVALLSGCALGGPGAPKPPQAIVELTAANPLARVPFGPIRDARSLRLSVLAIDDKPQQGIVLHVSIVREGGPAVRVGTAGPFPFDHPSDLRLAMTPAMAEAALGPRPEVALELASALQEPLRPEITVAVTVSVTT